MPSLVILYYISLSRSYFLVRCLLFVFFFLFDELQKNAVLEPRTAYVRELVGFKAKAKTNELKKCLQAQGRS